MAYIKTCCIFYFDSRRWLLVPRGCQLLVNVPHVYSLPLKEPRR